VKSALLLGLSMYAACALAQPAKEKDKETPAAEPGKERRSLNLRLDNPSSFATERPEKPPAKGLPSLGDDARKVAPTAPEPGTRSEGGPYPADTNPNK